MAEIEKMRALVEDLDGQHAREQQAFGEGFTIGFEDGFEVGYGRAHREMAEAWHEVAERVRALGRSRYLTYAELETARYGSPREVAE